MSAHAPVNHFREMVKIIESLGHRHERHTVFSDFVEMSAISISNAIDIRHRDQREERYMQMIKRYDADELRQFPRLLGHLVEAFEDKTDDHLGRLFHELELHNTYKGQFFTPYAVCQLMASVTLEPDFVERTIEERGFMTMQEPACGAGATMIALTEQFRSAGANPQRELHITAIDIDIRCVHMAYIQLALLHIPAIVIHGNTLSLEEFSHWFTPAHVLDAWNFKLRRHMVDEGDVVDHAEEAEVAPAPSTRAVQLDLF